MQYLLIRNIFPTQKINALIFQREIQNWTDEKSSIKPKELFYTIIKQYSTFSYQSEIKSNELEYSESVAVIASSCTLIIGYRDIICSTTTPGTKILRI